MDYEAAVRYLLSLGRELAAPTQAAAAKFDLENIQVLADRLSHPQRSYPSAHIAGTNGKGSTAAFLESILRCAEFRTGLNTSPHLERINERIRVSGEDISDAAFAETLTRICAVIERLLSEGKLRAHPTYFECVTAMAFEYFARQRVEFAVFEVGLGGRLDATNIVTPVVSVITRIDFDHENFLGHSLQEIAGEKAGIAKRGIPLILAEQREEAREVILARARDLKVPVVETGRAYEVLQDSEKEVLHGGQGEDGRVRARVREVNTGWTCFVAPGLRGKFQLQNALNAIAAARVLKQNGYRVSDEAVERGIAEAAWPGRLEKLQSHPDVYLDGAHNPSAARELLKFLRENFDGRQVRLLFGALRDKAVDEIGGILFPQVSEVVFTEPRTSRAISATQLAEIAGHHAQHFRIVVDAERALEELLEQSGPDDIIFVAGSLYLVGQLRHYWKQRTQVTASAS